MLSAAAGVGEHAAAGHQLRRPRGQLQCIRRLRRGARAAADAAGSGRRAASAAGQRAALCAVAAAQGHVQPRVRGGHDGGGSGCGRRAAAPPAPAPHGVHVRQPGCTIQRTEDLALGGVQALRLQLFMQLPPCSDVPLSPNHPAGAASLKACSGQGAMPRLANSPHDVLVMSFDVVLQHRHHRAGSAEAMRPALGQPSIRVVSASAAEPRNPFNDARCQTLSPARATPRPACSQHSAHPPAGQAADCVQLLPTSSVAQCACPLPMAHSRVWPLTAPAADDSNLMPVAPAAQYARYWSPSQVPGPDQRRAARRLRHCACPRHRRQHPQHGVRQQLQPRRRQQLPCRCCTADSCLTGRP